MQYTVILVVSMLSLLQCQSVTSFALVPAGHVVVRQHSASSATSYSSAITLPTLSPFCPKRIIRGQKTCRSSTQLHENLWDRLDIEEDEEPQWYVLNCVAGLEMDLLRQCRDACGDMPDVVKFVVPRHRQTRSHGASRMITEEKVLYLGYVFAKLRLCPPVYEAIRSLSLCRSWMGPVNQKGYRKLPPAPVALSDEEIVKFGLEAVETEEEEEFVLSDDGDVIFDSAEKDAKDDSNKKFEEQALKVYLGLRVDDMVKVTAKGKFFNEDGIVRRLKEGKILVRFYTYGSMYDEWLEPDSVRKLSNIEILKGLSGPGAPITQNDLEGGDDRRGNNDFRERGPNRRELMSSVNGAEPRNRRQDREGRGDRFNNDRSDRGDRFNNNNNNNFNNADRFGRPPPRRDDWNQDRPRQARTDGPPGVRSQDNRYNNDNRRPNRYDSALSDEDSQWGRGPPQQQRGDRGDRGDRRPFNDRGYNNDNRRPNNYNSNNNNYNSQDNRRVAKAIDGNNDWSAFVAPAGGRQQQQQRGPPSASDEDQFFASLMSDLTDAVNSGKGGSSDSAKPGRRSEGRPPKSNDGDDFFASLMSEISTDSGGNSKTNRPKTREDKDSADDFFAALEAELGSAFDTPPATKASTKPAGSGRVATSSGGGGDDADDFFARLEAEMSTPPPATPSPQEFAGSFQKTSERSKSSSPAEPSQANVIPESAVTESPSPPKRRKVSKPVGDESGVSSKPITAAAKEEKPPSPSSSPKSSAPNPAALDKCTVPVLKEMLRERGLKLTGKKSELIERLTQ